MTQHFRENIIEIIKKYDNNEKYTVPDDLVLPEICTNGEDVVSFLTEQFEWLLENGKIDHCFELDSELYWFPFKCYYNWARNVTLCMICLRPGAVKRFAVKKIQRATDYTSHAESDFEFIPNYFDFGKFIIPNMLFDYNSDYDGGLEIFHQMRIAENTNDKLVVKHNADTWAIDKNNYEITVNDNLLEFKDLCYPDSEYSYDLAVILGSILDDSLSTKITDKYNELITSDIEDAYDAYELYVAEGDKIIS